MQQLPVVIERLAVIRDQHHHGRAPPLFDGLHERRHVIIHQAHGLSIRLAPHGGGGCADLIDPNLQGVLTHDLDDTFLGGSTRHAGHRLVFASDGLRLSSLPQELSHARGVFAVLGGIHDKGKVRGSRVEHQEHGLLIRGSEPLGRGTSRFTRRRLFFTPRKRPSGEFRGGGVISMC